MRILAGEGIASAQKSLSDRWDEHVKYEFATRDTEDHGDAYHPEQRHSVSWYRVPDHASRHEMVRYGAPTRRRSLRPGEYLYYDLGNQSFTANPVPANPPFQLAYRWETKAHTFNSGLNFRF